MNQMPSEDRLYFRQLLSGRDFAEQNSLAQEMVNFCYLIGDSVSREAVVVDPAHDIAGLCDRLDADGMKLVGVLATHHHPDHLGGDVMGFQVEGVCALLERGQVPVHVQRSEARWVVLSTGLSESELRLHDSGDVVHVGKVDIELVHTPGHTPGSQCFAVAGRLVAGDTVLLEGCGRTDLPGGDPEQLYESLNVRLARFSDDTLVYPGHLYSAESSATLGDTRKNNYVFRIRNLAQWMAMFGGRAPRAPEPQKD
jgi:glyoxylase-like metal-dependent hydrolase (beta-lactamase superfamily II)